MSLGNLDSSSSAQEWDQKWEHIFDQYQRDLRHAHYIRSILLPGERRVLELAAGSFRDMAALCRMGVDCSGMDFSSESVERARAWFPEFSSRIHKMSAFSMPLCDGAFDVTYHNGFWVLFNDANIGQLAAEQARITRSRIVATVHNGHNPQFVEYFERRKETDSLFDIRFFTVDEMHALMSPVCDDIQVIPVGKANRYHEDRLIRMGLTHPRIIRSYLRVSGHRLLERSERLLCIGKVRAG